MTGDATGSGGRGSATGGDLTGLGAAEAVQAFDGGAVGDMPQPAGSAFPGPVAAAFYACDDPIVAICGPVGSGKTTTLVKSRIRRARMMPRSTIDGWRRYKLLIGRHTYRQLWSTTIPSYLETIPKALGEWSGGRGDPVTHRIEFEDDYGPIEWTAEFVAYGDSVTESLRGAQATDFWLSEMDTMHVEVLTTGIGRIDRWPARPHFEGYPPELRSYGQIVGDLNAPEEDNWTFPVLFDEQARERIARQLSAELPPGAKPVKITLFRQPGARDPGAENLQNLAPGYYANQVAAMTLAGRGDQITRLIDNRTTFTKIGTPVFEREFSQRIHVAEGPIPPDPQLPLRLGFDQGFLGACVIAQFRPPMHWRVLAELMFPKERLFARTFGERLADLLEDRFPGLVIGDCWGDLAGESGASQAGAESETWNRIVGAAIGKAIRPQHRGGNRVAARLEAVRGALEFVRAGEPGLLIDPSCRHLIAGLSARYVWADEVTTSGDKRKIPDKRQPEANVVDALQYLLLSETGEDGVNRMIPARPGSLERRARRGGELRTGWDVTQPYGGAR